MWIREYDIFLKVVICDNNIFNRLTGLALFKRSLFYVQVLYVTTVCVYPQYFSLKFLFVIEGSFLTEGCRKSSFYYNWQSYATCSVDVYI